MKKVTALIKGAETVVNLQDSVLTTANNYVFVKKATVFWEYRNVPSNFTAFTVNSTVVNMYRGYYTFDDIRDLFAEHNVVLARQSRNGHCSLTTNNATVVGISSLLARMLGFKNDNVNFRASSTTVSDNAVDVNAGLKYLKIHCNIVNKEFCFDTNGRKSDVITTLPITTTQSIFGSAAEYIDTESKVAVTHGAFNDIRFNVTDQDGEPVDAGQILIELYIV